MPSSGSPTAARSPSPRSRGWRQLVARDAPGGVLARRLVPAALVVPAALALLSRWAERAGLYGAGFGRAALVASNSIVFLGLIWWTAAALTRADRRRRSAEAQVREREAHLATTLESIGDGVIATDDQVRIARINAVAERLTGWPRDEALGRPLSDVFRLVHEHTGAPVDNPAERVLREGTVIGLADHAVLVARDGTRRPIADSGAPIRDAEGPIHGVVLVFRDDSEAHRLYAQLEDRVLERTAELESANQELEAFSYSVAHDLRAPLRAISGFSEAVLEDAAGRLAPEDVRRVTQIRDAATRMNELIGALLDLARISRTEPRRRHVDVSALARTVIDGLRAAQPAREVEAVIGDGLVAYADPRLLEIVLSNLLGNAWKFTAKRDRARIEVGVLPGGPPPVYFVRDNGAGFDPAQTGKLFGAFQRLHTAAEFEGTGIGLATVQRIIRRHGGLIWAEAELDRGATFYFTLQAPPLTGRAVSRRSPS